MFLPLFFKPENLNILIVGGGQVAARKAENLLRMGCRITIIAPAFIPEIETLTSVQSVVLTRREYQFGDCAGFNLIIAATDSKALNRTIFAEANRKGIPINVVDDPELCTVIFPAVWREGSLEVAVGTGGRAPFLASAVRDLVRERMAGWGNWVEIGACFRQIVKKEVADVSRRNELLKQFAETVPPNYQGPFPSPGSLNDWLKWLKEFAV